MRKFSGLAIVTMGAALMPVAAFCQTPNGTPVKEIRMRQADGTPAAQSATATVPVEDQATKEQIARLFEVMRVRQQVETMKSMMSSMIQQQVKQRAKSLETTLPEGSDRTPEQKAAVEKLMNRYMDKALNIYPIEEMLNDVATVYQKHISRSDVESFIAFYSSTPGQHLLDAQPLIAKEFMPIVTQRVQERTKELTDEITRDVNELMKSSGAEQTDKPK
jgi:hypothetical protein